MPTSKADGEEAKEKVENSSIRSAFRFASADHSLAAWRFYLILVIFRSTIYALVSLPLSEGSDYCVVHLSDDAAKKNAIEANGRRNLNCFVKLSAHVDSKPLESDFHKSIKLQEAEFVREIL